MAWLVQKYRLPSGTLEILENAFTFSVEVIGYLDVSSHAKLISFLLILGAAA